MTLLARACTSPRARARVACTMSLVGVGAGAGGGNYGGPLHDWVELGSGCVGIVLQVIGAPCVDDHEWHDQESGRSCEYYAASLDPNRDCDITTHGNQSARTTRADRLAHVTRRRGGSIVG